MTLYEKDCTQLLVRPVKNIKTNYGVSDMPSPAVGAIKNLAINKIFLI
jgi:hypothetical protein